MAKMDERKKKKKTSDAGQILERITGDDPKLREAVEEQKLNARVAEMSLEAHEAADFSQADLAKVVGTTQSVISRLEDAEYDGHSPTMLQRIAGALHQRLEVRLVPPETTENESTSPEDATPRWRRVQTALRSNSTSFL